MNKYEYNKAVLDVLLCTKQNWPSTRTPTHAPVLNRLMPIPSSVNIKRITGRDGVSEEEFLNSGYTDLVSVMNIAEVWGYNGGRVLDWGVGCGRMFRHLPDYLRLPAACADVDSVNTEWLKKHTPHYPCTLDPHGTMPDKWDNNIGLLYSHSVMTHLTEADQIHWLKQINHVLASDGVAVISVHGLYAATVLAEWTRIPKHMKRWLEEGFRTTRMNNTDISDVVPDLYYQDTAHTPKYVQEMWGIYINVVDIISGGFGPFHDAVVCKKKG